MQEKLKDNVKKKVNNTVEKGRDVKVKVGATVKRGKKGFFSIVFSRFGIVLLLLAIQFVFVFYWLFQLRDYSLYVYFGSVFISLLVVIKLLNTYDNPIYTTAWIIPILILPVFGVTFYIFIQFKFGTRPIAWGLQRTIRETAPLLKTDRRIYRRLETADYDVAGLSRYVERYGGYPTDTNTAVTYFPDGMAKFKQLLIELEKAEKFIFMEYFIVEEGYMWDTILEILERKVAEGVEVRFMYDGTCSLMKLPFKYIEKLRAKGLQAKIFSKVCPAVSTRQNSRDHRKITVIDGKVAFTGGVNLADEYINYVERFGYWKDAAVMLRGDAVRSFTLMFLQMWNIFERPNQEYEKYLVKQPPIPEADGFVMGYGDSPLDNENVGEKVYLNMIHSAKRYVHIMTPYLVLDYEMQQCLEFVAKRGVEVSILLPHIPDKKYVYLLAKTYYKDLIQAGVHIYEYTPGFVHSKVVVVDDDKAVVGTINMDLRSLYLHFECAAYLYGCSAIADIEKDFRETIEISQEITLEDCRKQGLISRFAGQCLRLLAPLM